MNNMKVVAVGNPSLAGTGGERRNYMTLSEYSEFGVQSYLHLPFFKLAWALLNSDNKPDLLDQLRKNVYKIQDKGVKIQSMCLDILDTPSVYLKDKSFQRILNKRHPYLYWYFQSLIDDSSEIHRKYISTTLKETIGFDLVYQMGEPTQYGYDAQIISKKSHLPMVVLLQEFPYKIHNPKLYLSSLTNRPRSTLFSLFFDIVSYPFSYNFYRRILNSTELKGIFSVSPACFEARNLKKNLIRTKKFSKTLYPENAVEAQSQVTNINKENYAIYYARMVPEKGLYEIPKIASYIGDKIKVLVYGKFPNEAFRRNFLKSISQIPNIEYKGFAEREELMESIRRAKVVIYPSHADAFPLVIIEALSLGTSVVAYRIPGLIPYEKLPVVKLVKEFDHIALAREAKEVIELSSSEYSSLHDLPDVKNFVKDHGSWSSVTEEEIKTLRNLKSGHLIT